MRLGLAVLLTALLGAGVLPAQQASHLAGFVQDSSGAGIPLAGITVVHEDTGFRRTATGRADGAYRVAALAPGSYKVTIRKEGFKTAVHFGIKLDPTRVTQIDFVLEVGPMQETITVESSPAVLHSEDASVGTVVSRQWIDKLPINGRGIHSLLEFAPGTVTTPATRGEPGQFTANGQRPNSHYFTVDGVSVNTGVSAGGGPAGVTGGVLPSMTAFGSFHNLITLDALEEFRIQTSSALPEYGRLPGAQIAISSRSGTNDFHGSLFGYFRNERLDSIDWFARRFNMPKAPSNLKDTGATFAGPIRRNRAFFFGAVEDLSLRQPMLWRTPVPSPEVRRSAPPRFATLLAPFPEANRGLLSSETAEWASTVVRPSDLRSASIRTDWAPFSRVTLFGRFNEAPSNSQFGSWQSNDLSILSRSFAGGANGRITANWIADFRFSTNWARAESVWHANTPGGQPDCTFATAVAQAARTPPDCSAFSILSISGIGQVLSGRESPAEQHQWNLAGTATWTRARHQVRGGVDYRRLVPNRPLFVNYVNIMADSVTDLLTNGNVWSSVALAAQNSTLLRELSVYGQDSWRVTSRLTVSGGARWEFNPPPIQNRGLPGQGPFPGGIAGTTRSVIWPLRYNNIAPRFGAAYRVRPDGMTVVRGAYGVYYDSSLGISTDLVHGRPAASWQIGSPSSDGGSTRRILDYNFDPSLKLPVVRQWNITAEHASSRLGGGTVSASLVGSQGRDLLRRELRGRPAANFVGFALATNTGWSDYRGLQLQYRARMAEGVSALVSYSWSHSIDTGSTDAAFYWAGEGSSAAQDRGSSDFDVRHALNAAFSYETRPGSGWRALTGNWAIDGVFRARTGFPVDLQNAEFAMGIGLANAFRPNVEPAAHRWLSDPRAPGGRRLNRAAFTSAGQFVQGNLGRNTLAGLGMNQLDVSFRRDFKLSEKTGLQLRLEAFNALNKVNFADPVRFLASPLFGESTSLLNLMLGAGTPGSGLTPRFQIGGPRSLQMVVKFRF